MAIISFDLDNNVRLCEHFKKLCLIETFPLSFVCHLFVKFVGLSYELN